MLVSFKKHEYDLLLEAVDDDIDFYMNTMQDTYRDGESRKKVLGAIDTVKKLMTIREKLYEKRYGQREE